MKLFNDSERFLDKRIPKFLCDTEAFTEAIF